MSATNSRPSQTQEYTRLILQANLFNPDHILYVQSLPLLSWCVDTLNCNYLHNTFTTSHSPAQSRDQCYLQPSSICPTVPSKFKKVAWTQYNHDYTNNSSPTPTLIYIHDHNGSYQADRPFDSLPWFWQEYSSPQPRTLNLTKPHHRLISLQNYSS
jgi:hypothetical protein